MSEKYESSEMLLTTAERCIYPVVLMCRWLSVSRSGFYDWHGLLDAQQSSPYRRLAHAVLRSVPDLQTARNLRGAACRSFNRSAEARGNDRRAHFLTRVRRRAIVTDRFQMRGSTPGGLFTTRRQQPHRVPDLRRCHA